MEKDECEKTPDFQSATSNQKYNINNLIDDDIRTFRGTLKFVNFDLNNVEPGEIIKENEIY